MMPITKCSDVISIGEPLVEFISLQGGTSIIDATQLKKCPAGGAAVFAAAVAKLGVSCSLIGTVGDEGFGDYLVKALESEGVNVSCVSRITGYKTGLAFTDYDKSGSRRYIYYRDNSAGTSLAQEHIQEESISKAKVLYFPGTTLIASHSSKKAVLKAVRIAKKEDIIISFDPNIRTEMMDIGKIREAYDEIWSSCRIAMPSETEITLLTNHTCPEKAARQLLKKGVKTVIVTLGDRGCLVVSRNECFQVPAIKVKSVDPTGAGDTFNAAFVVGILRKYDVKKQLGLQRRRHRSLSKISGTLPMPCQPESKSMKF